MNDLNAQQIVLLTLLVSFITSIATGITTVSLLEQAPEPVTQTINRIVEKTVERVVEIDKETNEPQETIIETIIVNAEDLTIEAVEKNSRSLVRIYTVVGDIKTFATLGFIVSESGEIVTDAQRIISGTSYVGVYESGEFPLDITFREPNNPFAKMKIQDGVTENTFNSAIFANSQGIKLAQSVIALSGRDSNVVSTGIITDIETSMEGELEVTSLIDTSVDGNKVLSGSVLLNLQGEIIGVKINGDPLREVAFLPANRVSAFLSQ